MWAGGIAGTRRRGGSGTAEELVVSMGLDVRGCALGDGGRTCQTNGRFFKFASANRIAMILHTPPGAL